MASSESSGGRQESAAVEVQLSAMHGADIVVITADGETHTMNQRILAACSLYFRALFARIFMRNSRVRLKHVKSPELFGCLCIAESVERKDLHDVKPNKCLDLLPAASFLCMDTVLEVIRDVIVRNACMTNLIELYRFSLIHHPKLAEELWNKILNNFSSIYSSSYFLGMTEKEFSTALNDENLIIRAADEVHVLSQYLKANPQSEQIRQMAQNIQEGDGEYMVIKNRYPKEVIATLGGWAGSGPSAEFNAFSPRSEQWTSSAVLDCEVPMAYHTLTVVGERLVMCGGMNGTRHFETVRSLDFNTLTWSHLPDMVNRRCYGGSAALKDPNGGDHLMVVGGFNGTDRIKSTEIFSFERNEWKILGNMDKKRSDACLVNLNGTPIVVGGFDGRTIHNDGIYMDTATGVWYPLQRRMHCGRTGVSAVGLTENLLFVVGGFNGTGRLRSAELYDIREGIWHYAASMQTTRSNFGIELMDDLVYVAGGYDGHSTTLLAERFSITAQKWETIAPLPSSRSALKLVRIEHSNLIRKAVRP